MNKIKWEFDILSMNENITWDILKNNPNIPWDMNCMSINPNITFDIVENNLDKKWSWYFLSQNPSITYEDIINNPDKKWDFESMSFNKFEKDPFIQKKINKHNAKILLSEIIYDDMNGLIRSFI